MPLFTPVFLGAFACVFLANVVIATANWLIVARARRRAMAEAQKEAERMVESVRGIFEGMVVDDGRPLGAPRVGYRN